MANAATCLWLRRARQTRGTHIDRFLAVKLDSDPGLLNDIQVEACDGQGCVAAGNKQRLGQVKSPLKLRTTATPGPPTSHTWPKAICQVAAGCLPPSSASPGNAPLRLNALHPGVVYVFELQVVIHAGSVDTHGNGDWAQSIG